MKRFVLPLFALLASASFVTAESGKEITIEGKGCCPKCCLKKADECGMAVAVDKDGKKTTYFIVENETSKAFHSTICKAVKPVKVTGTCVKNGDKLEVTASKIEEVK
jgi:hypothetical protein